MHHKTVLPGLLVFALSVNAQTIAPETQQALNSIRPSELKGDLSFLASDLLQGRYTPSPGLDIAAEFIASKFRAIGLEPAASSGYFQLADMVDRKLPRVITPLIAKDGNNPISVEPASIQVSKASGAVHIVAAPVLKISDPTSETRNNLKLDGKVILIAADTRDKAFDESVASSKALLELVIYKSPPFAVGSKLMSPSEAELSAPPVVQVVSRELADAIETSAKLTLSLDIPAPDDKPTTLKNVIGVLPGSDPALKSTCVLLTAHYDHIGTTETASGLAMSKANGQDIIYNGANDDGSGTVSVIEIARALSELHPKRSIVFITFFGEERGLIGSSYYGLHPLFPISKTIADLNLEQLGRTDSTEGPELQNATVTGFDYSTVTKYLEDAGKATGVKIYKDESASDDFFVRSDNAALAELGIPAHTIATAIEYPDYHAVGDEWQKIDYDNMAKVDRAIALAVLNLANAKRPPEWNEDNPKTERFRQATEHPNTKLRLPK